jgi:CRP-like cAMP-binding protein
MPIFGAIRGDTLEFLVDLAREIRVKGGDFFFQENDEGASMFVLEEGEVTVIKNWHGEPQHLTCLQAGDCFGEMSLLQCSPRSASILAATDCVALELTNATMLQLYERDLEQFTIIQMNVGREIARRLRRADERLFASRMQSPSAGDDYDFFVI